VKIDSGKKAEKTGWQKLDEVLETQPFSLVAQAFADKNVPCPKCGAIAWSDVAANAAR